MKQDI